MSFRRIPFQFTTTDPAERHSELMRRFGVPSDTEMLVEQAHLDGFFDQSSPRLQHRIPQCLAEGRDPMFNQNVDASKNKPRERIIPIQIEGATSTANRQRTRSGGSVLNSRLVAEDKVKSTSSTLPTTASVNNQSREETIPVSHETNQSSVPSKPKVVNIPVFVEGRDNKQDENKQRVDPVNIPVKRVSSSNQGKQNGPCVTKPVKNEASSSSQVKKPKSAIEISLDQISAVLEELDSYKEAVQTFSGVQGDKQYRYLDEMLTRCMLKLDDVETQGNEEVRKSRKAAVREVEKYVCMLDSKVKVTSSEDLASDDMPTSDANVDEDANKSTTVDLAVKDAGDIQEEVQKGAGIEEMETGEPLDPLAENSLALAVAKSTETNSDAPAHEKGELVQTSEKMNNEIEGGCEKPATKCEIELDSSEKHAGDMIVEGDEKEILTSNHANEEIKVLPTLGVSEITKDS